MAGNILNYEGASFFETVYLGHDNKFAVLLRELGDAYDVDAVTTMSLAIGDVLITSSNSASSAIRWGTGSGFATGEVEFQLGQQEIEAGRYPRCYLTLYDPSYENGRVWPPLQLLVLEEVEPD